MATVDKNFRIKNGLVVEGTTGTINGNNILTENGGDTYILNLVGGATLVKSVDSATFTVDGSGNLTVNSSVFDAYGAAATAESNAEGYTDSAVSTEATNRQTAINSALSVAEGYADTVSGNALTSANSYTDSSISSEVTRANGAYDVSGAASQALTDANSYTDSQASAAYTAAVADANSYSDSLSVNYDANGQAAAAYTAAVADAGSYTDGQITSALTTAQGYATTAQGNAESYADTAASNALSSANTYTDGAITNLVDGAPTLLDTLKELAQAIDNDASYASTLTTALGGKQDNLTASTGITIDGSNNISVTANTYDAYGAASTAQGNAEDYADTVAGQAYTDAVSTAASDATTKAGTAETNAKSYADSLASNYDPAGSASTAYTNALNDANGYTDGYVGALKDGTEAFTDINLNNVTSQRAVQTTLSSVTNGSSVMAWAKADYGSAKLWVKFATATHSQISEVLITTDAANNVAITEFAIVGTNGNMGSVTATYLAGNLAVEVDTVYANTTVTVSATLIK
jgi:hypothetical protein